MWSPLHRRSRSLHTVDQLLDLDQLSNGSLQCRRCRVSWPATRPERPLISLRNATNFVSCRRPTEPFSSVAEICAKVAGCRGSTSMVSCTVETPASTRVIASCATTDTTPHFVQVFVFTSQIQNSQFCVQVPSSVSRYLSLSLFLSRE